MNYRQIYEWGTDSLKKAQITEAELDARLLLEAACRTNRTTLFAHPDREVTKEEEEKYRAWILGRSAHIPLQQLTGVQNFMGFDFFVNEHVLIPRQDTEILVEEVMLQLHDGMRILDLCTGSGCILISLLKYSNDCSGVGTDLSEEALAVAAENAARLGLRVCEAAGDATDAEKHITICKGDLYEKVEGRFDIIVSNPPYIESAVIETLAEEVKAHEPRMALDGGADGLAFYRRIIEKAGTYLNRGGQLFFEIGFEQAEAVCALMAQSGFHEITVKKDYAGLDRVVYGTFY